MLLFSDTSGNYGHTPNAFIFSLRNKERLGPFKSMVAKSEEAIVKYLNVGPVFGDGYDIYITDNANTNSKSYSEFSEYNSYHVPSGVQNSYTLLAGTRQFTPDDYEVFYLV